MLPRADAANRINVKYPETDQIPKHVVYPRLVTNPNSSRVVSLISRVVSTIFQGIGIISSGFLFNPRAITNGARSLIDFVFEKIIYKNSNTDEGENGQEIEMDQFRVGEFTAGQPDNPHINNGPVDVDGFPFPDYSVESEN